MALPISMWSGWAHETDGVMLAAVVLLLCPAILADLLNSAPALLLPTTPATTEEGSKAGGGAAAVCGCSSPCNAPSMLTGLCTPILVLLLLLLRLILNAGSAAVLMLMLVTGGASTNATESAANYQRWSTSWIGFFETKHIYISFRHVHSKRFYIPQYEPAQQTLDEWTVLMTCPAFWQVKAFALSNRHQA